MSDSNTNVCTAAPTLVFACSGAADVGAVSDLAARELTAQGAGKMYCLAGIGGRVPGILKTTSEAEKIRAQIRPQKTSTMSVAMSLFICFFSYAAKWP